MPTAWNKELDLLVRSEISTLNPRGSADEFKNAFERKHGTSKVSLLMKVGTFIGDFDVMGSLA